MLLGTNTRKLIIYLRNLSDKNNLLFIFFNFGDIFSVPIKCYHFQSRYNPRNFLYSFTLISLDTRNPVKSMLTFPEFLEPA